MEVWSLKLQKKFYEQTCLDKVVNHDWEGEIKSAGNKVMIRVRPTVTVGDYTSYQDITYQDLTDDKIELQVDKQKYFAFKVDDIDQAQADINIINETTQDASEQMKITVEQDVFANVYSSATSTVDGATTLRDSSNIIDWIIDAGVALDENKVGSEGRFLIIPPWVAGMIKKSDLRDASLAGDGQSILRNGRIGMIDRFTLYVSNNLVGTKAQGTPTNCIAGTRDAISFASQFTKTETVRLQNQFGDAIRGLKVYGYQVTQPDALVHATAASTV